MNVILCVNNSENNTIGKNITEVSTVPCVLKQDCSIINPTIILDYDSSAIGSINYIKIPELNRCYFVNDVELLTGHRYMIKANVDVLESFRTDILSLQCIIDKQESRYKSNMYYDDGSYVSEVREYTETISFSNGFNDSGEFILITAGG